MKKCFYQRNILCLLLILLFSLGLLTACTEGQTDGAVSSGTDEVSVSDRDAPVVRTDDGIIDEGLLIPPEDFNISFSWGVGCKNAYDTYHGKITKDLVSAGTETKDLFVTKNDRAKIYTKLMECDILSITEDITAENLVTDDEYMFYVKPMVRYRITVTVNGSEYYVVGDETAERYPQVERAANFVKFVKFVRELARSTPEFQAMPEAVGGYL